MTKSKNVFAAFGIQAKKALGLSGVDSPRSTGNKLPAVKPTARPVNDRDSFKANSLDAVQAQNKALKAKIAARSGAVPSLPVQPSAASGRNDRAFLDKPIDIFRDSNIKHLEDRLAASRLEVTRQAEQIAASPTTVSLAVIVEMPGRRRKMAPDQYIELRENLRNNAQGEPVTVHPLEDGRFAIISGHHRVDALRELGRRDVRVHVLEVAPDDVARIAFFANLIRAQLSDFQMFRGFEEERRLLGPVSQAELGRLGGLDRRRMSELFVFEHLPADALLLLDANPHALGVTSAASLVKLAKAGEGRLVVQAIQNVIDGSFNQGKAAGWVRQQLAPAAKTPRAKPVRISPNCSYLAKGKTLEIEFKTRTEREAGEVAIVKFLQERAAAET